MPFPFSYFPPLLCWSFRHPRKILLFRQGDFYEALGHDAVQLVEHAGLNPMSGAAGTAEVPKAGCPVSNLRATLRTLTDAGFSVAVGEEAPQPFGLVKSRAPKERFIAGVVTPASPVYLNGYVELEADGDLTGVRAGCFDAGAGHLGVGCSGRPAPF